jgi:hypothetical protein
LRDELRTLAMKARIFQASADIFAVVGIGLFAVLFYQSYSGHPLDAFKDVFFVVTVLLPFVPAAVLAAIAAGKRKQIKALLEPKGKSS